MHRTLHLHFAKLDISSESLDLDPFFERLYAGNDLRTDSRFTPAAMTFALEIAGRGSPDRALPAGAVFAETNLCGGRCYYARERFVAVAGGDYPLRVEYGLDDAIGRVSLDRRFLGNPQAAIGRVIRPLLQSFLLPFVRLKSIHAAAAARNGRGILLTGAGGAGKTTTALQLARDGFTLLSDDGALVTTTAAGEAVVLSSLDYAHATERTLALFPDLRAHVVGGRDHRDKYAIARAAFATETGWRAPAPLAALIELHRCRTGQPALVPRERGAALADLVRDSMVVFRHPVLRQPRFAAYSAWTLGCLAAIVSGTRTFRLDYADHHLPRLPRLIEALTG